MPHSPSRPRIRQHRKPPTWTFVVLTLLLALTAAPSQARLSAEEAEQYYREGQEALADGRYDAAAAQFQALSREDGAQVDRAIYWQAYAEAKAGHRQKALRTLDRLAETFPDSPWLDDARALELELGGVETESAMRSSDDELKLYALDALMNTDPDRAVELIDDFLKGQHPHRLKRHALFILAQTNSPRADEILARMAGDTLRGLHRDAIQALGVRGGATAEAALESLYRSHDDREAKILVLHALLPADAAGLAAKLALEESDPDLRDEAIRILGAMDATSEIERVARELGPGARKAVFQAYGVADDAGPLLRVVRESSDADELADAIDALVIVGSDEEMLSALLDLYGRSTDRRVKEKVLNFLMIEDEAASLIEIFRTEEDPELKRQALQYLSHMEDPEVTGLIEQLLKG